MKGEGRRWIRMLGLVRSEEKEGRGRGGGSTFEKIPPHKQVADILVQLVCSGEVSLGQHVCAHQEEGEEEEYVCLVEVVGASVSISQIHIHSTGLMITLTARTQDKIRSKLTNVQPKSPIFPVKRKCICQVFSKFLS